MDKCAGCQYYDRQTGKQTDSRGVQWGQCRRSSPMLHPINQKSYMIEGVWPHVRDDDWCGEWKAASRRVETRVPDSVSAGPLAARRQRFAVRAQAGNDADHAGWRVGVCTPSPDGGAAGDPRGAATERIRSAMPRVRCALTHRVSNSRSRVRRGRAGETCYSGRGCRCADRQRNAMCHSRCPSQTWPRHWPPASRSSRRTSASRARWSRGTTPRWCAPAIEPGRRRARCPGLPG